MKMVLVTGPGRAQQYPEDIRPLYQSSGQELEKSGVKPADRACAIPVLQQPYRKGPPEPAGNTLGKWGASFGHPEIETRYIYGIAQSMLTEQAWIPFYTAAVESSQMSNTSGSASINLDGSGLDDLFKAL